MKGIFTISLDFELHWGGFEKWPLVVDRSKLKEESLLSDNRTDRDSYNQYFLNTRKVIPKMLALFEQYNIHVTWATVGMLMHKDRESLWGNFPNQKPQYWEQSLSAYSFIEKIGIGDSEEEDPFHYADSLIQQILKTKNQELGSHSFSHYYCNEAGQTVEQFRADLQSAQKAASSYGVKLRSLVFPRNQFNDDYLKACYEEGFESVRSNPLDWFWNIESTQNEGAWKRLSRGLDAYFPIGKKNTYTIDSLKVRDGFPISLPASRLLRPYRPSELFLNQFKVNRIIQEMQRAARAGEVYHLWWHPHNFGYYTEQSLEGLEQILEGYKKCVTDYGMLSLNMGELVNLIKPVHEKEIA